MDSYEKVYKAIEKLINDDTISSYRINKDTGISYGNINDMRRGERKIENLSLKNAGILYRYQQNLEK